jgi:predicted nucleic acid-binding protein
VTLVLDAGGLSALAGQRARLLELRRRRLWPAQVPAVVLTEALTGDHRRDFATNRLLRACQVRAVDETQAREAARLRTATGRAGTISAVDAVVAAVAGGLPDAVVITSDPADLRALAEHTVGAFRVVPAS